jgi:hypothetical protein
MSASSNIPASRVPESVRQSRVFQIIDSGVIGGEVQLLAVIELLGKITKNSIVAASTETISHWWLLGDDRGQTVYWGTEESFADFCERYQ